MRFVLLVLLFLFFIRLEAQNSPHLFVISGVVVNSGTSKKIEDFVHMLERKSGYTLKPFYVNSYTRLSQTLHEHPDALAWTCGAPYVEDHKSDAQQLLAVPLFKGKPTYYSLIVTRKDNHKKKLRDFKSDVFVYSDPRSNSGYLAPSILLKNQGFEMENFFRVKILAGTHEKSIEALYKGLADVAAIDEYVWVEYLRLKPYLSEELHVIEKSGPFPFTPIVAGKNVSKKLLEKLQRSLTDLSPSERKVFKDDFNIDGFVIKDNSFYTPIQKMLEDIAKDKR